MSRAESVKKGDRVVLMHMREDPRPIERGTKGTVLHVDSLGTIHVKWDNGRTLGLIEEAGDDFDIIQGVSDRGSA